MSSDKFLEFSKPFIESSKNVFETMFQTKIEAQKPSIKKTNVTNGDVSSFIGVSGYFEKGEAKIPYKGILVFSWPYKTYCKLASVMLNEVFEEYSDEFADIGAEVVNMVMGNAKRTLASMGYTIDMALPSVITGEKHTIAYPPGTITILIPVVSAHGEFFIEVGFKSND